MSKSGLFGVIAAIATPFNTEMQPDTAKFIDLARRLLDDGCDALNVCGTTGEATSMSVAQRKSIMHAASENLPGERLMVGTGAAALADAIELTVTAGELGFAGALLLPPFYYKNVPAEGIVNYFVEIARATEASSIPLYLYNFPALSGVAFTPELVSRLAERIGSRLRGLKDSSGDTAYAREIAALSGELDVFPSNEATLMEARDGPFAGCISATANINSVWCQAAYGKGDAEALSVATSLRQLVSGGPLIPRVKAAVAHLMNDPSYVALLPPHIKLSADEQSTLETGIREITDLSRARAKVS